jgi:hypothetical protein
MSSDHIPSSPSDALEGLKQPVPQEFDIHIDADGSWFHEGGLVRRPALVKLFSSVLRRETDGSFWLVTPVERGTITVADAPFMIISLAVTGTGADQQITFTTNVEDRVTLSADHPLTMRQPPIGADSEAGVAAAPYIHVRDRLEAKVSRPVFYELANYATSNDEGVFGVWSSGNFFRLEP